MPKSTEVLIGKYISNTVDATRLLYENNLFGHLLVLIYSSIDSMGLLDAEPSITSASGHTFKNWVKKYILVYPGLDFNDVDLWGARCAVLHTFTSQSDLSRKGDARQIQYFSGPKNSPMALAFVAATKDIDNGIHVSAHIEDTYLAFLDGLKNFYADLVNNCRNNPAYEIRLNNVLQHYSL
ncbi:hypothetical protein [Undibacterium fentianense]|uniref:Uncharacterized protein n=1 Tax=Undibacterium fentianense TaxID=2828728 RepID=A0A941IE85_9BURK|nr:hypothetical protein [Undibacterium fentianense]MBR7799142.1 hypothetical protein [Undibacterium fentianense]